jgi:hypothetical protein
VNEIRTQILRILAGDKAPILCPLWVLGGHQQEVRANGGHAKIDKKGLALVYRCFAFLEVRRYWKQNSYGRPLILTCAHSFELATTACNESLRDP